MAAGRPSDVKVEYRRGNPSLLDQENGSGDSGVTARPSFCYSTNGAYVFSLHIGATNDIVVSAVDANGAITIDVDTLVLSASSPTNLAEMNLCLDGTGRYLYVADGGTRLYTIDVLTPAAITEVHVRTVPNQGGYGVLLRNGDFLYLLADGDTDFSEIVITTPSAPAAPTTINAANTTGQCTTGVITPDETRILYPSAALGQIGIINITAAGSPVEVTPVDLPLTTDGYQVTISGAPVFLTVPSNTYFVAIGNYLDTVSNRITYFWLAYQKGANWSTPNLISHDDTGSVIEPLLFDSGATVQSAALVCQHPKHAVLYQQTNSYAHVFIRDENTLTAGAWSVWDLGLVPRLISSIDIPGIYSAGNYAINSNGILFVQGLKTDTTTEDDFDELTIKQPQGWVEISDYVLQRPGIHLRYGISGSDPTDRVADTGTLTFQVDNSQFNTAKVLGKFSPDHASLFSDFAAGQEIRLTISDSNGSDNWIWRGWIDSIQVIPGSKRERRVTITCVDVFDSMAKARTKNLKLYEDVSPDQVFSILLNYVRPQPVSANPNLSDDVYPFVFDQSPENETAVLTEMQKLAQSARAYIYTGQNGLLKFEARNTRAVVVTPSVTIDNGDLVEMVPVHGRSKVINRARASVYPRREDTSAVVLFTLDLVQQIEPGQSISIIAEYKDPAQKAQRVGASSITPPATPTDYLFNTAENGSGTNISASLGVRVAVGANQSVVTLTNNYTSTGYVTFFQLRGIGLYSFEPLTFVADNTNSQDRYGVSEMSYELPYHSDPGIAEDAANYLVSTRKDPQTFIESISVILNNDVALMDDFLEDDVLFIGDRIAITETVTGLSSDHYFVQSAELHITDRYFITATFGLIPASTEAVWILQDATYGILDSTTVLGSGFIA